MPATEVVTAAAIAAIIQGLQAWFALAKLSGISDEQLNEIITQQRTLFNLKAAKDLPDA